MHRSDVSTHVLNSVKSPEIEKNYLILTGSDPDPDHQPVTGNSQYFLFTKYRLENIKIPRENKNIILFSTTFSLPYFIPLDWIQIWIQSRDIIWIWILLDVVPDPHPCPQECPSWNLTVNKVVPWIRNIDNPHGDKVLRFKAISSKNNIRFGFLDPKNIYFDIHYVFSSINARTHGSRAKKIMSDLDF